MIHSRKNTAIASLIRNSCSMLNGDAIPEERVIVLILNGNMYEKQEKEIYLEVHREAEEKFKKLLQILV